MPAYSSELNPDEQVWNHAKARLGKCSIFNRHDMQRHLTSILGSMQKQARRIFHQTSKVSRWPWAQTIVTVGLLKPIHGRWSCIPLAFGFYLRRETLRRGCLRVRRKAVVFADKFAQAVALIARLGAFFGQVPVLVVTDSWFGNNGLLKPLRERLGQRVHLLSRLRVNAALYALAEPAPGTAGRPRKYGERLGNAADLAATMRTQAQTYTLHVYGALREVVAAERWSPLKLIVKPLIGVKNVRHVI